MAVINHILLSELEDEIRFDPQYYTPENMLFEEEIKAFQTIYLGSVASITDGQHGYFKLDENSEIRQITAKCIKEGLIDKTNADRLSHITHNNNLRSSLAVNDVLVTTAGTIGQIGLVTEEIPPANIDQDIGRIAIHNNGVSPYFVWAFLQSKFGRFQIERFTTGQVQTHLSLKKMKKLRIPLLSNHAEVEEIVKRFVEYKVAGKEFYTQAQQLLESELGLNKLRFDKPVGYTARFSELESSLRFDPEHFYPTFKALCAGLPETVSLEPLYRFAEPLKTGIQPTYLEDGEYEVINSKHIGVNKIDTSRLRRAAPAPYSVMASSGDILLNATGRGTLGRCAVLESDTHRIFDVCIIRIRPVGIDPYFLSALLNTRFGQLQMELHTRGTSGQLHLYPRDARNILIWPAPESLQAEVRELMTKAARSAQEATQLLDQAKSRVEQLIEEAVRA